MDDKSRRWTCVLPRKPSDRHAPFVGHTTPKRRAEQDEDGEADQVVGRLHDVRRECLRLLGEPTFLAPATEAVWTLAQDRSLLCGIPCAVPARRSTAMASEYNKRLIRRALDEIYEQGNLELVSELVHPDFVDHEPAHREQPTGPQSVKQTVRQLQGAFGELRFKVEDEIAEGNKVVQLVTMSGRHTGPLLGREPTGREFAVRHVYIWGIADDKIVEHWGSRDDLGLLAQLGLLPVDVEPGAAP